jgi:hypothetical protein
MNRVLSLADQRDAWTIYSSLHILHLGGVPESSDMCTFTPQLWQEQTRTPATYMVWNDRGLDPEHKQYIMQTRRLGHHIIVNERTEQPPDESVTSMDPEDAMERCARKMELWTTAKSNLKLRGREQFNTRGLSAHGIVPPHPNAHKLDALVVD